MSTPNPIPISKPVGNKYYLNIDQVARFLPHRAPFLLVDRILEIHPVGDLSHLESSDKVGIRVVGIKNFTYNEPFVPGHFPGFPIVPGVLLLECMAQVSSFSLYPYFGEDVERLGKEFQCILAGVDSARFRRPVIPGDTLRIETKVTKCRGKIWAFDCVGTVDGQKVVEAQILANLVLKNGVNS